jgi:hypothetical protein
MDWAAAKRSQRIESLGHRSMEWNAHRGERQIARGQSVTGSTLDPSFGVGDRTPAAYWGECQDMKLLVYSLRGVIERWKQRRCKSGAKFMRLISVAFVDDHPVLLSGLASLFANTAGFEVVGNGATSADAIQITIQKSPDILVMDLNMPVTRFMPSHRSRPTMETPRS